VRICPDIKIPFAHDERESADTRSFLRVSKTSGKNFIFGVHSNGSDADL
jgi:hypothetical protein